MKKTAFYVITALAALSALAGCNKEVAKEPTFPQTQELMIAVGEQLDVTFTADAAWKLTIDANWLAFVDGETIVPQLSGAAGEQTVTITTADVTDIFSEETAVVEITMGSKTQALCNITRVAEQRTAKMWIKGFDATEAGFVPSLSLIYDSQSKDVKTFQLAFTANFDWTVESYPEWMTAQMISGTASDTPDFSKYNYVGVKKEYIANAQEGSIVIKDQNSEATCSLPVTYSGMGDADLIFTSEDGKDVSDVYFSYDGYVMKRTFEGYQATESKEFNVNVISKGDYAWAAYNYDGEYWSECYWIKVYKTDNGYKITTENAAPSDYGDTYFFMIPKSLLADGDYGTSEWNRDQIYYSWMSKNSNLLLDEWGNVKSDYSFMVHLEQKPASADGGFIACLGDYMTHFTPVKFQEKYPYDPTMLMPSLPVDNTWCIEVSGSTSYALQLAPKDFPNDWRPVYSTSEGSNVTLVEIVAQTGSWPAGQESKVFEHAWIYAPGDWTTSYPGASFSSEYFNEASGKCFVLFFKDAAEKESKKPSAAIEISKLQ